MVDWNDEETANSSCADHYHFYKLEKWTKAGTKMDAASRSWPRGVAIAFTLHPGATCKDALHQ
jgi:hypothetical protein